MNRRRRLGAIAFLAALAMGGCAVLVPRAESMPVAAATTRTYTNPVFARDFPDPMVLWYHGWYYAYGTTAQWQRLGVVFPILTSRDLVHWRYVADAMPIPSWGTGDWWAPDVLYSRGTFYMYYVGMSVDKQVHCIGVATSRRPTGPFADHGPLACADRSGQGYIDPAPFVDTDGRAYLYFSVDAPHHSISVLRLAPDLLHTVGPRTELFGISQPWERGPYFSTVEGPFVVKRGGLYYCFYSGNDWQHDYAMGYATASHPLGPFTKNPHNPILHETAHVKGPGGGSIVLGPQGAESWLAYHAWDPTHSFRDLRIDRLVWHKAAAIVQGPTVTPQPLPPRPATSPGELAPPADRAFVMGTGATYTNPVIAQTTPDPAMIKALDGYYYVIATSDYWQGGAFHLLPIYRSTDLVHWTFVGDSFPTRPAWVDPSAGLWAPDLQYDNHTYYMYYVASNTNPLPAYSTTGGSAIGVATAATPAGPWTDAGPPAGGSYQTGPIVPPRPCVGTTYCGGPYFATIDPAEVTDHDGQKYLYYGSYFGGTVVQKLQPDGLHTTGPAIQVGHWDRYEGTYVVRHDVHGRTYYYTFSSAANCCGGPNTAYSVEVSRATSPLGPFVDQNGFPMERPTAPVWTGDAAQDTAGMNSGAEGGGYPTLKQNGNRWNGVGHNALIADLSGRDWIVYHGVDKTNGWVNGLPVGTGSITFRQLLIDPVDWTADGWPVVNGGAGPSDGPNVAPATTPLVGDNINPPRGCTAPGNGNDLSATWTVVSGAWDINPGTCTTGGYAEQTATSGQGLVVSTSSAPSGYRAECDLRLEMSGTGARYGCVVSYRHEGATPGGATYIAAFLDPALNVLVTVPYQNGRPISGTVETPLPARFDHTDWHHLAVDEDVSQPGRPLFRFTVSERDRDPLAVQERALPAVFGQYGSVGFITLNAHADFDNVTVARRDTTVAPQQQTPPAGTLLPAYSDDFNGTLGAQWSWLREDPSRHALVTYQGRGQLEITVNGDLYRDGNNATNLLLETPPSGNYMAETKLTFDPNNNFQQAGLLVYGDDDHYIKVGPAHLFSLNKMIAGHESLEPVPSDQSGCDVRPSSSSKIAVKVYTAQQCPNEGESWDDLTNPQPTTNGSTASAPTVTDWLRIYHQNGIYTPFYSLDNVHWVRGASWTLTSPNPARFPIKMGLFAFSAGPNNTIPAYFDYVHLYSRP